MATTPEVKVTQQYVSNRSARQRQFSTLTRSLQSLMLLSILDPKHLWMHWNSITTQIQSHWWSPAILNTSKPSFGFLDNVQRWGKTIQSHPSSCYKPSLWLNKQCPKILLSEEKPLSGSFSQVISHSMVAKRCFFSQQANSRNLHAKCIMEEYAQRNFFSGKSQTVVIKDGRKDGVGLRGTS